MTPKKYPSNPELDAELFDLFQNGRSDGRLAMQYGLPLDEVKVRIKRARSLKDVRRSRARKTKTALKKEDLETKRYTRAKRIAGHGFRDVG